MVLNLFVQILDKFRAIFRLCHGLLIVSIMLFGLLSMAMTILPCFTFALINPFVHFWIAINWFKKYHSFFGFTMLSFILEYLCRINVNVHLSPPTYHYLKEFKVNKQPGSMLWCMNHRTRIDWLLILTMSTRFEVSYVLTIISRSFLRFIPIVGWVLCWVGIFLNRNWNVDRKQLMDMIRVLSSTAVQKRSTFLLFPEGTDLWPKAITKSNQYADKHSLRRYQYVLHPRTLGFTSIVKEMDDNLFCINDITIGYVDFEEGERCNEALLAGGRFPKSVHFYVETYTVDDIVDQFQEHYTSKSAADSGSDYDSKTESDGDEQTEFSFGSFAENDRYIPSAYVPLKERVRQKWLKQIQTKEGVELVYNALTDWTRKSFEVKEERLKDWYQNGRWIEDERYKIDYSFVPRSHYVVAIVLYIFQGALLVWLWNNVRWYIYLVIVLNIIFSVDDTVGKVIRSYRGWVNEMESKQE